MIISTIMHLLLIMRRLVILKSRAITCQPHLHLQSIAPCSSDILNVKKYFAYATSAIDYNDLMASVDEVGQQLVRLDFKGCTKGPTPALDAPAVVNHARVSGGCDAYIHI